MNRPQRVFITGIASGIGLALARRYAQEGALLGGCGLETLEQARSVLPANTRYWSADVCDPAALRVAIDDFARDGLNILIASAGISMPKATFPDFQAGRKVFEVNVLGLINAFEPALDIMRRQGHGQLVALGSFAGIVGLPGMACYGASKAAVLSLCESLAADLHAQGIAVTAAAPGFVNTPLTRTNPHRMPFLLSPDQAAAVIHQAIRLKRARVVFPWPMAMLAALLHHLPRSWYLALMRKDPMGLRR